MKKLLNVFALIAIVTMLFASCSPSPRAITEDDIAILTRLGELVDGAVSAGRIVMPGDPSTWTDGKASVNLENPPYEGTLGDLTSFNMSISFSSDLSEMSVSFDMAGNLDELGTHSFSASLSGPVPTSSDINLDDYNVSAYIDGSPIDPNSLKDFQIPGVGA